MTPKERAAMQQALEALELARGSHGVMLMSNPPHDAWQYRGCDSKLAEAITALREALADHTVKCKGCDELFDKICLDDDGVCASCGWPVWPAKKQAEQEPMAEVVVRPLRGDQSQPTTDIKWLQKPTTGKLYTHPVRTKDLTDDEIVTVLGNVRERLDGNVFLVFARAVIAKFKEKNRG